MKKMTLMELNERMGSDLMLEIYKRMPEISLDLEEIGLDEWLKIHQKAETDSQKQEVAEIIKEVFGVDIITSPIVGTLKGPLVNVGDVVEPGTVVSRIEEMMVPIEVKADVRGVIVRVLAEDGQAVEYGQPLFAIKLDP